jgi:L-threonylcarbamoyladenylate synthase
VTIVPATPHAIAEAARYVRQGGLVAFPTETVYGLGADATNDLAVAAIFSAKGRPTFNPLIAHVPNIAVARRYARLDERAERLAAAFWPGPLTMILPRHEGAPISHLVTAGLDTVALRAPAHPVALALLAESRTLIAAPSANRSGHVSPTTAAHVAADLGDRVPTILDGGPTDVGLESTIVDMSGDAIRMLRPGLVSVDDIMRLTGARVRREAVSADAASRPNAPGQLASHYAPRARLRLEAARAHPGEALLAFGPLAPATGYGVFNLSPRGDLLEAAAHLFAALRLLDATGVDAIAVMPIPAEGLGEAINDRLRRAAAPRPA